MIPGLNTEVYRRGRGIHIQTEAHDRDPIKLTTHVFVGGAVIHTVQTRIESHAIDELTERMRRQHREVHKFVELGRLDAKCIANTRHLFTDIPLAQSRSSSDGQTED